MINEDFVSFETAKLLKAKGFTESEDCFGFYDKKGSVHFYQTFGDISDYDEDTCIDAPTLQMAMKWLREKHYIIIIPSIRVIDPIRGIIDCYCIGIYYIPKNNGGAFCFISPTLENGYSSYEEACEAGIKYCLEDLI